MQLFQSLIIVARNGCGASLNATASAAAVGLSGTEWLETWLGPDLMATHADPHKPLKSAMKTTSVDNTHQGDIPKQKQGK